jgi:proline iminopeptidase
MCGVDKWMVFGGSWGSTLSLAYAQTHPDRVTEIVLRGIFLFAQHELDWLYKYGASELYPEGWDDFVSVVSKDERNDLVGAYRRLLTCDDEATKMRAAKAWSMWEGLTVTLLPDPEMIAEFVEDQHAIAIARIENHYMANKGWLEEGQLLKGAEKLRGIPGVIVQGRHDCCTPPRAAWELKRVWPEVELNIIPDGGHLYNEPGVLDGLIRATDKFAE